MECSKDSALTFRHASKGKIKVGWTREEAGQHLSVSEMSLPATAGDDPPGRERRK